ncbi:hypothetical protein ACHSBP_17485 [Pseudoalteromonas sp. XMcav1-K]|uniref:alpha/beta hydrolase n=1 Tax=Pseudoalteromonas sp. XMcav1-K TaxID=3374372 RepID=UPI003757B513
MNYKTLIALCLSLLLIACDSDDALFDNPSTQHVYPAPSGQYRVGIMEFDITDYREDKLAPELGEQRKFTVRVHYPSQLRSTLYHPYFDKWQHQVDYLSAQRPQDAPIHPRQHELQSMLSWSNSKAPIAYHQENGWPVLFYSHGLGLFNADNTELQEELASHGFAVVSINHTYLAGVTSFQNGEQKGLFLPSGKHDVQTPAGRAYFDNNVAPEIAKDVLAAYQWLTQESWQFEHQLNLNNVGMLGFSLGASAAMNACQQLLVCKAAANMDGIVLGDVALYPLNKPLLLFRSENPFSQLEPIYHANQNDSILVSIHGSQHNDFTDQNRWIVGYPSEVDKNTMHNIVKQHMQRFFSHFLKAQPLVLAEFEGVSIQQK